MMDVSFGKFLKLTGGRSLMQIYHPLRVVFDIFDKMNLNKAEKENIVNIQKIRDMMVSIIQ